MNKKLITAKEIVARFSISFQTVNHYTDFGLLSVVTKKGNQRLYDETEVKNRLTQISKFVSEGYSLRLIRRKLIGI
jgi:DNA-binding transcriptional MerR regulator